ncbi:MAG TPA: hypothetical protein VF475_17715 [Sphingobium sp.]
MTDKTDAPKDLPETTAAAPAKPVEADAAKKGGKSNAVWMGTAVGVGSAALVAALMYAKRRK